MRARSTFSLCLLALVIAATATSAPAKLPIPQRFLLEDDRSTAAFKLEGSNGYTLYFGAYSEHSDGRGEIFVSVARKGEVAQAAYRASAIVSDAFVKADLGPFGKVDLTVLPSGRERTVPVRCSRGETYTYEPATYEGIVEFKGESGYVEGRETRLSLLPFASFCGGGSGYGESINSEEPGARLKGSSFSGGRKLLFQINKNHPRARTIFTAALTERRSGITIYRRLKGVAGPASFRYDPKLQTARLSPPPPFSGSATLTRSRGSVSPNWAGNLSLDFLGHPDVPLAGRTVHVTLVHARFTRSDDSSVTVGT